MTDFTTRPEISGTFGMATSTHWIASATGFGILERGGNAFDAAVAMGLTLQIVEPQLNGPAGEVPVLFQRPGEPVTVLCGQGVAPAGATIAAYRALGLEMVPGSGLLATVTPGAWDAWLLLLRDQGTMTLAEVLAPAIALARSGHPLLPRVAETIAGLADFFRDHWPTSAAVWLPGGRPPPAGALFTNPDLADSYQRLADIASAAKSRKAGIDAARKAWRTGFVAEAISGFCATAKVVDVTGHAHRALLSARDLAEWQAGYEAPLSCRYGDWTVYKTGPWGQGPVLLQTLTILEGFDLGSLDPGGPEFTHLIIEAIKLAYADREAYYGDPLHHPVPMTTLLSPEYAASRRALINDRANLDQRPGHLPGLEHLAAAAVDRAARLAGGPAGATAGEPTMAHLTERRGDTVHLDVIDRWGNLVSATPSGGWLQSSPVIPGLGFALNSRAQMFWLTEGLHSSLAPGHRPRTTLTPTLARHRNGTALVFGTPGGDQQDQWNLLLFLRLVHFGMGLQQAIDAPQFHSLHMQSSFYPRLAQPGEVLMEPGFSANTVADLRARGHLITLSEPWSIGRMTAARRDPDGLLHAGATPRLMKAYAVGR
ncbi:MAG: gamma-glutamyltransferase family protein [Desulforhopalus sp.]|jgi:gamma-glutamyltranspeptidase/glutathione hydrolase|nr:gamma-glutamyltransferase family protein [Desulforhopalus sp.]